MPLPTVSVLAWVVIGLTAGLLARTMVRGPAPVGVVSAAMVGAVGAVTGGLVALMLGFGAVNTPAAWFLAVIGGVLPMLFLQGPAQEQGTT